MQRAGIDPGECVNYRVCGSAIELSADEEIELIRMRASSHSSRSTSQRSIQERWRTSRRAAAIAMLMRRGNPQRPSNYISANHLTQLTELIARLQEQLSQLENHPSLYIAPEGCVVQQYLARGQYGRYCYNKLVAPEAMFAPEQREYQARSQQVRVIHLSRNDDPRSEEGRKGVARRDALAAIAQQLETAQRAVNEAVSLMSELLEPGMENSSRGSTNSNDAN